MPQLGAFDSRQARALQLMQEADERILDQEERIEALKKEGHPTARSERLLSLMRHSRALMEQQAGLLFKNSS